MILKYLPLIYLNHNRHKIEYYINHYITNSNFKFIPQKINYALYNYYYNIKKDFCKINNK
jgi:hypothetical protein